MKMLTRMAAMPSSTVIFLYVLFTSVTTVLSFPQATIDTSQPINVVDDDFLSITIDSTAISSNFQGLVDICSSKVTTLTRALQPAYLRIGGTEEDFITFTDINNTHSATVKRLSKGGKKPADGLGQNITAFVMDEAQMDVLYRFASLSNWRIIFGLNQLLLTPANDWNPFNAELLIRYCMKKGYNDIAWELGNEPDLYLEHNYANITGAKGASNAKILRSLLNDLNYPENLIAGPDVATLDRLNYLTDYMSVIENTIDAATWHHYYRNSEGAVLDDFTSPTVLDTLITNINKFRQIVQTSSFTGDIWLGETSSTYGGGSPLLSSSYVSGFMWLDKLGLVAYHHKKIFRQDLIGGDYALLTNSGDPLPDYWLTLLYKKLVGTKVLRVADAFDYGRTVRIYAHCAKQPYPSGSVVFLVLNLENQATTITVLNDEFVSSSKDIYWFTPLQVGNLTCQDVALNGIHLAFGEDNALPQFAPKQMDAGSDLELQGLSFGYVVFKNSQVKACM